MAYRETYVESAPRSSLLSSNFQDYPTFDDMKYSLERGDMAPAGFSGFRFEKEITAYALLSKSWEKYSNFLQISISACEFHRDQVVYVALLDYIENMPSPDVPTHELDDNTVNNIWDRILDAMEVMHDARM